MAATEASRRIAQAKASAIADLRASVSRVPARVLRGGQPRLPRGAKPPPAPRTPGADDMDDIPF